MSKKAYGWILASTGFFGSLLAPGSIITQDDLGYALVPVKDADGNLTGKEDRVAVKPPRDAIEIGNDGKPIHDKDQQSYAEIFGSAAVPFGGAAPAQSPGGLQLAANNLPALTAGHANLADIAGEQRPEATHGLDPTVGNRSPDVIEALTSNPDFMRRMAEALSAPKPDVVAQQDANAKLAGDPAKDVEAAKPAAGANAQSAAPTRRSDAAKDDGKK